MNQELLLEVEQTQESNRIHEFASSISAIAELFRDSVSPIDLPFTEERAQILEKLVSNPHRVIKLLPVEEQASAMLLESRLASSFDWNRHELASRLFLTFLRQSDESDESLAGLVRLASLSHEKGEQLYKSESASLLGVGIICRAVSMDHIEEAGALLLERGLVKEENLKSTYNLIRRSADEMSWILTMFEEVKSSHPSTHSKEAAILLRKIITDQLDDDCLHSILQLPRNEREWFVAQLYTKFCDKTCSEGERIEALKSIHAITEILGRSLEEVYERSLNLVSESDLILSELKLRARELVEEDVFGAGQLLRIAAQRLEDRDPIRKRRILNFLSVAWEDYPSCRMSIENYCASAIQLGHIKKEYLRFDDPLYRGERSERFDEFCKAILNVDPLSSLGVKFSPLLPYEKPSLYRLYRKWGNPYSPFLGRDIERTISMIARNVPVLSEATVTERAFRDGSALLNGGPAREEVLNKLISKGLISPRAADEFRKGPFECFLPREIEIPLCLSHVADRLTAQGTTLRPKELRRRVLEIGRTFYGGDKPNGDFDFTFVLKRMKDARYFTALEIAKTLAGYDFDLSSLENLSKEHRYELLCDIFHFSIYFSTNYKRVHKHWLPLFSQEELGVAMLNELEDCISFNFNEFEDPEKGDLFEWIERREIPIPTGSSASHGLANYFIIGNSDRAGTMEYLSQAGFSAPSLVPTIFSWLEEGSVTLDQIRQSADVSTDEVRREILDGLKKLSRETSDS